MFEITIQLLIFLLSFLIFYALLRKLKLFSTTVNATISFIFSFYVLYLAIKFPTTSITKVISYSLLVLLAFFAAVLIWKGFKKK